MCGNRDTKYLFFKWKYLCIFHSCIRFSHAVFFSCKLKIEQQHKKAEIIFISRVYYVTRIKSIWSNTQCSTHTYDVDFHFLFDFSIIYYKKITRFFFCVDWEHHYMYRHQKMFFFSSLFCLRLRFFFNKISQMQIACNNYGD